MGAERKLLKAVDVMRKEPGFWPAGDGLYLSVLASGQRSWVYRYTIAGRTRDMGLGGIRDVPTIKAAMELREPWARLKVQGIDPIEHRKTHRAAEAAAKVKAAPVTFRECAERYIGIHEPVWKNSKHRAQWRSTLEAYAYPSIGALPVQDIGTGHVLTIIEPLWLAKHETASRLRGRIEAVLDWATPQYRQGENPARLRLFKGKLPARKQVRKMRPVKHHPALPFGDVAAFMANLRQRESISARALEFTILTGARTNEAIGTTWSELDLEAAVWTLPAKRMKAARDHKVPLSVRAVDILRGLETETGEHVFSRAGKPLSNMAMAKVLTVMGRSDVTVHGFRSTFRDWAAEATNFPNHVVEMALAHAVEGEVEAAYRRGDLFEKRRRLADAWTAYCAKPPATGAKVVTLHQTAL